MTSVITAFDRRTQHVKRSGLSFHLPACLLRHADCHPILVSAASTVLCGIFVLAGAAAMMVTLSLPLLFLISALS